MSKYTVEANDDNFQEVVLESKKVVVVDFWAEWCGPCKMIAPKLDELAEKFEGKLVVAKVNVDVAQKTPAQYGVRSIPTLLFVKEGKVIDQVIGNVPKGDIEERVNNLLK